MSSIWEKATHKTHFDALSGNKSVDTLVIGGGIAGILCAYKLKNAGIDCILVEADEILGGITKNTTAKISVAHGLIYDKMIKRFGKDSAKLYLDAQIKACMEYERLCASVDCDYEKKDSYVYSVDDKAKVKKEITALKMLGIDARLDSAEALPFTVAGAVRIKNEAQFHPLKFLYAISKNLPIYENTKVVEIMPNRAVTKNGEICFKKVIFATHFPIINKHGAFFLKMYQHRSYVIALKNAKDVGGMYVDEADTGMSFRNYQGLLLLGGGGHRTGKSGGCWQELERFANIHYPSAEIVSKWATQDCMTLDDVPYIGKYSKNTPNMYVATGFNKWGMTSSMVAADILTDLALGKDNRYAKVFSPSRSILRPQLAVNAFETVVNLLTPTAPRCPHLGCALKYNSAEHSWDCPCHGSRFTKDGELIDNPATDDKRM